MRQRNRDCVSSAINRMLFLTSRTTHRRVSLVLQLYVKHIHILVHIQRNYFKKNKNISSVFFYCNNEND